jgi:hypothetical protein
VVHHVVTDPGDIETPAAFPALQRPSKGRKARGVRVRDRRGANRPASCWTVG